MTEQTFKSFDGKEIFYREWECENPIGVLQIVHGMAESSDRYDGFAREMNKRGIVVFCDDHRGHGVTDDRSGYSEGDMFFDTLRDVAFLTDLAKKKYDGFPYAVFGHSYGSFLTQSYLENYGDKIDCAVVGGSAYFRNLQVPAGEFVASLGCLFGKGKKPAKVIAEASFGAYNKKFASGTFISSLEEECRKYDEHPDCNFTLSYHFYKSFFNGVATLYRKKNAEKIPTDLPLLLVAGQDDPVGGMGKLVERLYRFYKEEVGVKNVTLRLFPGVRHEYLNDTSREEATKTIGDFVEKAFAAKSGRA